MCEATLMRNIFLIGMLLPAACSPVFKATRTGILRPAPKAETCDFVIASTLPGSDYSEVGVVDFMGGLVVQTASDFKTHGARSICELGGEYVVGEINGHGFYIRGIVFAKAAAAAPAEVVAAAPQAAAPVEPRTVSGTPCEIDTPNAEQCSAQCEAGQDAAPCHRVAGWYELGRNTQKNIGAALKYYDRACSLGSKSDCTRAKLLRSK